MDATEFDGIVASAPKPDDRIAWFGALLAREARTRVEIVGGSAIEIYLTSAEYVSEDIDLVGRTDRLIPVLRRWKFHRVEGRSHRAYWVKKPIGLVDLVGPGDRSGLRPRRVETPFGPVLVSAVEPLILRRLTRASREHSDELYGQAVRLARHGKLDWEYLATMAKYEGVAAPLKGLKKTLKAWP